MTTQQGERIVLIDGGYCANNPTLYAIADATVALKIIPGDIRVVSVGVGSYPEPAKRRSARVKEWICDRLMSGVLDIDLRFFQKTLSRNTYSMDVLRERLCKDIPTIRISNSYTQPELATGFIEHDLEKLDLLYQRGRESFREHEARLREFFL